MNSFRKFAFQKRTKMRYGYARGGDREAGFVSLGDSWCDTTNEMGRFMLTGIAELERDLIRKRCAAGIAHAKAKGKRFGRPLALDAGQRQMIEARHLCSDGLLFCCILHFRSLSGIGFLT